MHHNIIIKEGNVTKVVKEILVDGQEFVDEKPLKDSTNSVTSGGVAAALKDADDKADGIDTRLETVEAVIPSGASESNKVVTQSDLAAAEAGWQAGYTPKGPASVSTINGLTGQQNGDVYTLTDGGTVNPGSLTVSEGDQIAWDATNSVWYKFTEYATKKDFNSLYNKVNGIPLTKSKNLLDPSKIFNGYYYPSQANFDESGKTEDVNYSCFKFVCKPSTDYCVTGTSFIVQFYRADDVRISYAGNYNNNSALTFTTPLNAAFFTVSFKNYVYNKDEYMLVEGTTLPVNFEKYGVWYSDYEYENVNNIEDILDEITELKFPTNVYDGTHTYGKSLDSNGALSDNASRSVTSFIHVEPSKTYFLSSDSVKCGFVRVIQYAEDFSIVTSSTNDYTFETQATTKYIRLCTTTALMENKFMITSMGYVDYVAYEPIKVIPKKIDEVTTFPIHHPLYVKADGSGDYSTVYEAVSYANSVANDGNVYDIYIVDTSINHVGTEFDIFAEMYESDVSNIPLTPNTFAGLPLNGNVNLIGIGKVKLLCHLPDSATLDQSTHMSVVDCNASVYVENLTFEAKNCRYPWHDESLNLKPKTKHIFKNCKFTHLGNQAGQWASPHAIGIGFSEACDFEFYDCVFDASASGGYPFDIHNYAPQLGTTIIIDSCEMIGSKNGYFAKFGFNGYSPVTSNPTKYYACWNDVFIKNIIATGQILVDKETSEYNCTNNYRFKNFTDFVIDIKPDWIIS